MLQFQAVILLQLQSKASYNESDIFNPIVLTAAALSAIGLNSLHYMYITVKVQSFSSSRKISSMILKEFDSYIHIQTGSDTHKTQCKMSMHNEMLFHTTL